MPFIPGRSPNPSYYRGIPGAKDGDAGFKRSSNGPRPEGREVPEAPRSTGWSPTAAAKPKPAPGAPDPEDKASLKSLQRAELRELKPTSPEGANNLLEAYGAKAKAGGVITGPELWTIKDCVSLVRNYRADPKIAQKALDKMIASQSPEGMAARQLKELKASLG